MEARPTAGARRAGALLLACCACGLLLAWSQGPGAGSLLLALQGRTSPGPVSRRAVLAAGVSFVPAAVSASGGATAGKTTSIPRAKLRYYDRVSGAVGAFQNLEKQLADKAACKAAAKSFFSEQDEAPLAEFKSAGYLLAVAFKIDGKIPPDRIPQVKDYKAMMKDFGALQTAMSAGSTEEAKKIYAKARGSAAAYLDGVELPPLGDAVYSKEDPFAEKLEDTVK